MFWDHEFGFMSDIDMRRYFDIYDSIIYPCLINKENEYSKGDSR